MKKILLILILLILLSFPVYALSFQDVTNFFSSIYKSIASFFSSAFSVLLPKSAPTGGGGGGGGAPSSGGSSLCSSDLSLSSSSKDTCTVTATITSNNCVNRTYEIKDGGSKCSGTIDVSSFTKVCIWSVTTGSYTYGLYIDNQYKFSKSVTCSKSCTSSCGSCSRSSSTSCVGTQTCTKSDCSTSTQSCNVNSGTSCGTTQYGSCTLSGQCGTGTQSVTSYACNGVGSCASSISSQSCTVNCPSGQTCNSGQCCTPKTCSTYSGQCGQFSDGCGNTITCNCPTGQSCNSTTNSCYTPTHACSDGTDYGQCSSTKPLYCSSGTLINACGSPYNCGCPTGQTCKADGSCQSVSTSYSYIVGVSGSNYQILNGATQAVLYQSTSSSTAVNYLLGSSGIAADGSSVYVNSGAYSVDHSWQIRKNKILMVFSPQSVLTEVALPYPGEPVIVIYGNNVTISNATIDGNGLNQYPSPDTMMIVGKSYAYDGITVWGSNCLIEYSTIHNCRTTGIKTEYQMDANNLGVMNCKIYDVGANCLQSGSETHHSKDGYFINNEVYHCSDVGIDSYGDSTKITGNYVHDCGKPPSPMAGWVNSGWDIGIEMGTGTSSDYIFIANNTVTNPGSIAIAVEGPATFHYVLVSGNTINNGGDWCGIRFDTASDSIAEFNSITNSQNGIYIDSGSNNNDVFGNTYSSCNTNFHDMGTGTVTTQPSIAAVTVASSPLGAGVVTANGVAGYAGSYSTSPYTFYGTVGSSVTLVANAISPHTFSDWSDNGAQTHTITIPPTDATYTATFT